MPPRSHPCGPLPWRRPPIRAAARVRQAAFASSLQYEMTGGASGEKDFLWIGSIARWAYDQEQLTAIAEAIAFDAVDVAPPLAEA